MSKYRRIEGKAADEARGAASVGRRRQGMCHWNYCQSKGAAETYYCLLQRYQHFISFFVLLKINGMCILLLSRKKYGYGESLHFMSLSQYSVFSVSANFRLNIFFTLASTSASCKSLRALQQLFSACEVHQQPWRMTKRRGSVIMDIFIKGL